MDDPKEIVRSGYDKVSLAYRPDDAPDDDYPIWLEDLADRLLEGAEVIDLGCGCGIPAARRLSQRGFRVLGVDISPVQIARARQLVPTARFVCQDMAELDMSAGSADAIVCLWSIIHVPLDEQPALIRAIHRWLRPGGWMLVTVGLGAWTGTEDDWCEIRGALMYWSHESTPTYLSWMRATGFDIEWERFVPEGDGGHVLVLARAI